MRLTLLLYSTFQNLLLLLWNIQFYTLRNKSKRFFSCSFSNILTLIRPDICPERQKEFFLAQIIKEAEFYCMVTLNKSEPTKYFVFNRTQPFNAFKCCTTTHNVLSKNIVLSSQSFPIFYFSAPSLMSLSVLFFLYIQELNFKFLILSCI